MFLSEGITLIVGGGYHDKSTLLKALELGVYNHIKGDGREYVITDHTAMKIRAEDGRAVSHVNISPFINNLPNGKDTVDFSTEDASGSTSQAANVVEAVNAGAKFIVSPGFDPEIVDYCLEKKIPVLPGCISPSEVAQAVKRGLTIVKFFPAEQAGGIAMIKAMAAPYVGLKFMPTGGINAGNLTEYLSCDKILGCRGSWMVKGDLVKAGNFGKIRVLSAETRKLVDTIRK